MDGPAEQPCNGDDEPEPGHEVAAELTSLRILIRLSFWEVDNGIHNAPSIQYTSRDVRNSLRVGEESTK